MRKYRHVRDKKGADHQAFFLVLYIVKNDKVDINN